MEREGSQHRWHATQRAAWEALVKTEKIGQ